MFAKENKVNKAFFSFNSKGACPLCNGKGIIISEMAFMESIETVCDLCNGKRYSEEVLKYKYKSKNIAEVMDLSVEDAISFFEDQEFLSKLISLEKVGLSYLHLNQSLSSLSGGELQRIKLATYLNQKGEIFIIDEPTDGLHLDDVRKLMLLFNEMVDNGNSLFLVEHSIDVIKNADYIVELGKGGGKLGGNVLFTGTPIQLLNSTESITNPYIVESL